eukprot:EG_transcript_28372
MAPQRSLAMRPKHNVVREAGLDKQHHGVRMSKGLNFPPCRRFFSINPFLPLKRFFFKLPQGSLWLSSSHTIHRRPADFGISAALQDTLMQANTFIGTLLFMSPERLEGGNYS